jgi:hypothetical protein
VDLARQYPEQAVKIVDTGTFGLAFVDVELLLLEKDSDQQPEDDFEIIAMHRDRDSE